MNPDPLTAELLANGPFARDSAKRLANMSSIQKLKGPAEKVEAMYRAAYGRPPETDERDLAVEFVSKSGTDRWIDLAHSLLIANEFTFVD